MHVHLLAQCIARCGAIRRSDTPNYTVRACSLAGKLHLQVVLVVDKDCGEVLVGVVGNAALGDTLNKLGVLEFRRQARKVLLQ